MNAVPETDMALWLQHDAAYLYREAHKARLSGGALAEWLATLYQRNAAHSARLARITMGIEPGNRR